MCGIIAVLRRRSRGTTIQSTDITSALQRAVSASFDAAQLGLADSLSSAADALENIDTLLRGTNGIRILHAEPAIAAELETTLAHFQTHLDALESSLDERAGDIEPERLETINAGLVRLRDAAYRQNHRCYCTNRN